MDEKTKITWLKRALIVKILLVLFMWGLPALVGTAGFLSLFGVSMPEDPFFMRVFGAVQVALGLLYWYAYQNPSRNRDIIKYAVLDNGLSTLTILGVALTSGLSSWFFWVSGAVTAIFTLVFWLLIPEE